MPSFDVVSEIDMQEVRNAVDQAQREISTRFDFKDTDSSIELGSDGITLHSATEDRLRAVAQVLDDEAGVGHRLGDDRARELALRHLDREPFRRTLGEA